ncbi:MAG TPA: hypothetical protein VGP23_09535, partial [Candidatus Binataceae bacterium]|nr:hypothetical protein [Candidatus Binataceae bacterium]
MNRKTTRAQKDGGGAPLPARPPRGEGNKSGGKIADKSGDKPGEKKAGDKKTPPSAIHTVARDVLLPYQVRWIADDAAVKVAEKSRRVGITWAEAADAALSAAATAGMDTWYLGYNRDMAREFVETAAAW